MVASAPGEASGKIWSRTSPRSEDDAEALGAFAEGNVSVRTAATSDAGTGEFCGCVAVFFSAAAFSALRAPDAGDDFATGGFSLRTGCSTRFCGAVVVAVVFGTEGEESGRVRRVFCGAMLP